MVRVEHFPAGPGFEHHDGVPAGSPGVPVERPESPAPVHARPLLAEEQMSDEDFATPPRPERQPGYDQTRVGADRPPPSGGQPFDAEVEGGAPAGEGEVVEKGRSAEVGTGAEEPAGVAQRGEIGDFEEAEPNQERGRRAGGADIPDPRPTGQKPIIGAHEKPYSHTDQMLQPKPPSASPQLATRARSFQHDALTELFDRSIDDVYEYAHALCGDHPTAERVCEAAFESLLERLPDIQGEGQALTATVLAQAEEAVRHLPHARFQGRGVRDAIAKLPAPEHEAITLRLVAGLDPELIATATARRTASVLGSEIAALRALRGSPPGLNFAMPAAQRQLDAALDRLLDGESPAAAAELAPALAEAEALLMAAASLVSLPAGSPPPEVRARLRNHFLAGGEERRAHWVHQHHLPAVVPGRRARPHANPLGAGAALVLSGLLAVVAGVLLAFAANFSTPSSAMYPLKRADENFLLAFTFDRVARANLEVKLSDERMREAETEAATRHSGKAVQAMSDRFDSLRAAAYDLGSIKRHSGSWKKVRDYYIQQASAPVDPLNRLLSTNGMKTDAESVARLNEQFQQERKTLERGLGDLNPTQPGAVPSGAPNTTPAPQQ